jgi:hypothetical protein
MVFAVFFRSLKNHAQKFDRVIHAARRNAL